MIFWSDAILWYYPSHCCARKIALKGCPKRTINRNAYEWDLESPYSRGGRKVNGETGEDQSSTLSALDKSWGTRVCKVRHLKKRTISWTDEQENFPSGSYPRKLTANVECSCWSSPRLHLTSVTGNTMRGRWSRWALNLGAFRWLRLYRTFVNRLGYISGFVTPILEKTVLDDVRIDVFEDMW